MARLKPTRPRGVVAMAPAPEVQHRQYLVEPPLDAHLEHFWSVRWRFPPGAAREASTLPHPCFHLVVESDGRAEVAGVPRARYRRTLSGEGWAFGVKFRPGAMRALLPRPASDYTDRVVPLAAVLGPRVAERYRRALLGAPDDEARAAAAGRVLLALLPPPAPDAGLLQALVEAAASERELTTVEALRARAGLSLRELQRWFRDAVGVSPKWVIQRYRLHEALLALETGEETVAEVAARLGYADQAHFARDFKRVVGLPPSSYRKGATQASERRQSSSARPASRARALGSLGRRSE